jgi:Ankyrin repeats (3 copies)
MTSYRSNMTDQGPVESDLLRLQGESDVKTSNAEKIRRQLTAYVYSEDLNSVWPSIHKDGHSADEKNGAMDGIVPILHSAVKSGLVGYIKQLLSQGADVNKQDMEGRTALHIAMHASSKTAYEGGVDFDVVPSVVRVLLKHGANIHIQDRWGQTPLGLARTLRPDVVKLFLDESTVAPSFLPH